MVYPILKFWFYPFCKILIRRVKGIDNVPDEAPFIIISNHERRLLDSLLIIYPILKKLNKKVHFLANTGWWFLGEVICRQWSGCIPLFDPKEAYKEAKKLIISGEIVGIFPEGDTKRTKNPKTGALRLAIETNTPILPIGIKSSWLPFDSTLNIGKTVYLTKSKKNIKKQIMELMEYVYKLRKA